ncbi:MAG: transcription factor S [Nanoarchaeota archaeon]|nr:transcription factor S [Nanoarchaeota archaeon]
MDFCPKCGAVLVTKVKNSVCPRCKYVKKGSVDLSIKEKIDEKNEIPVIKKNIGSTAPIVTEECSKCGHDKAYFWMVQTRSSDESPTKFFKCVKCGHTRRDYR